MNTATTDRLTAIDRARGLIIVLMVLDHARFFLARAHSTEWWGGAPPVYETAWPLIERVITHVCAPGFFFLMGASMTLYASKCESHGVGRNAIIKHFLKRGVMLILLEAIVVRPVWMLGGVWGDPINVFNSPAAPGGAVPALYGFSVLSALGGAMIICGALLWLKRHWIVSLAIVMALIAPLSFWAGVSPTDDESIVARLFYSAGKVGSARFLYPILPWCSIALLGVAFGRSVVSELQKRAPLALLLAVGGIVAFAILASFSWGLIDYGHARPQQWWDWLNLTKYPPSPGYLMLYVGSFVVLLFAMRSIADGSVADVVLRPFGRAPLFAYVAHLYLLLAMSVVWPFNIGPAVFYLLYVITLVGLWFLCRAYLNHAAAAIARLRTQWRRV